MAPQPPQDRMSPTKTQYVVTQAQSRPYFRPDRYTWNDQHISPQTTTTSAPTTFRYFPKLPLELKIQIWKHAIDKRGIHFLAVALRPTRRDRPWDAADPEAWRRTGRYSSRIFVTTQGPDGQDVVQEKFLATHDPCHDGRLCLVPYTPRATASDSPDRPVSSHKTYSSVLSLSGLAETEIRALLRCPRDVCLADQSTITVDLATDLLYIKFFPHTKLYNSSRHACHTYSRFPDEDLEAHFRPYSHPFHPICRIAIEIDPKHLDLCTVPINGPRCVFVGSVCHFCHGQRCAHGSHDDSMQKMARFLSVLPYLREVYLVFPTRRGCDPDNNKVGMRYCATGPVASRSDVWATGAWTQARTHEAEGAVFSCGGGTLREPAGVPKRASLLADVYQWWFVAQEGSNPQGWERKAREAVQFRILVWD